MRVSAGVVPGGLHVSVAERPGDAIDYSIYGDRGATPLCHVRTSTDRPIGYLAPRIQDGWEWEQEQGFFFLLLLILRIKTPVKHPSQETSF